MNITWIASPNCFHPATPRTVEGIVLHDLEGSLHSGIATFQMLFDPATGKYGTSAHYLIGADGVIVQMVNEEDIAYHVAAFGSNVTLNRNKPTWLPAKYRLQPYSRVNAVTIGIELEGYASKGYSAAQYKSAGTLIREICARHRIEPTCLPDYGNAARITTHGFLQTDRTDPGPHFDWDVLKSLYGDDMATIAELQAKVNELVSTNSALSDQVDALRQEVAALRAAMAQIVQTAQSV